MDFGFALTALKAGLSVARAGWNGAGLSVKAQIPDAHSKMTLPYLYIEYPQDAKTTPGARCPWVPSITDLMADDWCSFGGVVDAMPPHVMRMHQEREGLAERTGKLEAFIAIDTFKQLNQQEQNRMKRQLVAMREYLHVLDERIAANP